MMSRRSRLAVAGVSVCALCAAGAVGAYAVWPRDKPLPVRPLDSVPGDVTIVAWLELRAVTHSQVWQKLVGHGDGRPGLQRVAAVCGFNPLDEVRDAIVFMRGGTGGQPERVGLVARGLTHHEKLLECVRKVVRADGGAVRRLEIEGVPAIAARGTSRAAFIGADGVVGGSEDTVRRVIRVIHGKERALGSDRALGRIWQEVAPGRDIVIAGALPESWREAMLRWVGGVIDGGAAPLRAVQLAGLGASVARGLGIGAVLEVRTAEDARALAEAARTGIARMLERPAVSLTVMGAALRGVQIEAKATDVVLAVELGERQLSDALDLALGMLGRPSS